MTVRVRRRRAKNFNPRTPCGVRPIRGDCPVFHNFISIHAPLAGCDVFHRRRGAQKAISIHAPLAGCDRASPPRPSGRKYFNPRTPCGVRRTSPSGVFCMSYFNPRTPCGVRPLPLCRATSTPSFQSTHPLRGATVYPDGRPDGLEISIHAPLAGCDRAAQFVIGKRDDFNPRTPCGVRQMSCSGNSKSYQFQSTHPLRGATDDLLKKLAKAIFQSTHPLRGATQIIRRFSLSN